MTTLTEDTISTRYTLLSRLEDRADQDSWKDFFDTYWRLIYSFAIKSGLTPSEAQDVVQETIICVARDIHKFQRDRALGSFKGWLGAAIASALGFLHRRGLIHRDVKPSNIIFVNGFPKLADVGLVSELTEPGSQVGTEGFIAPEGAGSPPADIYSLGKVLYEISTGNDRNEYPVLPSPLHDNADDRDLVHFNKIVLNACRTNPNQRYKSADELMSALLGFQFSHYDPRVDKAWRDLVQFISFGGPIIGICVIIGMLWRLIWLLTHNH